MDAPSLTLALAGERATDALARALAPELRAGDLLALAGELGAGKTHFARALIGARTGERIVPSPTFTLVQVYDGAPPIWHFDLYRLARPDDARELGLEEARAAAILLIEWPQRLGPLLPATRLDLAFAYAEDEDARTVALTGRGAWGERLAALAPALRAAVA